MVDEGFGMPGTQLVMAAAAQVRQTPPQLVSPISPSGTVSVAA